MFTPGDARWFMAQPADPLPVPPRPAPAGWLAGRLAGWLVRSGPASVRATAPRPLNADHLINCRAVGGQR